MSEYRAPLEDMRFALRDLAALELLEDLLADVIVGVRRQHFTEGYILAHAADEQYRRGIYRKQGESALDPILTAGEHNQRIGFAVGFRRRKVHRGKENAECCQP